MNFLTPLHVGHLQLVCIKDKKNYVKFKHITNISCTFFNTLDLPFLNY